MVSLADAVQKTLLNMYEESLGGKTYIEPLEVASVLFCLAHDGGKASYDEVYKLIKEKDNEHAKRNQTNQ